MLDFIRNRTTDYNVGYFVNELAVASKNLGILEAKIDSYQFNSILIPMLQKKEAISSMYIEGTQTTITDVLKGEVNPQSTDEKIRQEVRNHVQTLIYGADYLRAGKFTHTFIKKIHEYMMTGIIATGLENTLGEYKKKDNQIKSSVGTVVYTPPSASETKKYMDELLSFMNNDSDGLNPLIKAAMIHSQFESIHPFSDGNGRIGRVLISLYLYKAKVINFPFFYISEAINLDKTVYYRMLTDSRTSSLDDWIKYFLHKVSVQTLKHIGYIDSLNALYIKTKNSVKECINSPKFDEIIECLFTHPLLNANLLGDQLAVSHGQAIRYLNALEEKRVLISDDRKRGKTFFFSELIDLAQRA
ncbi:MAG: Fic family protein [Lachnospiraceae bacterium]|nr:Fic family protein [Lachnospiraceae bacterium]